MWEPEGQITNAPSRAIPSTKPKKIGYLGKTKFNEIKQFTQPSHSPQREREAKPLSLPSMDREVKKFTTPKSVADFNRRLEAFDLSHQSYYGGKMDAGLALGLTMSSIPIEACHDIWPTSLLAKPKVEEVKKPVDKWMPVKKTYATAILSAFPPMGAYLAGKHPKGVPDEMANQLWDTGAKGLYLGIDAISGIGTFLRWSGARRKKMRRDTPELLTELEAADKELADKAAGAKDFKEVFAARWDWAKKANKIYNEATPLIEAGEASFKETFTSLAPWKQTWNDWTSKEVDEGAIGTLRQMPELQQTFQKHPIAATVGDIAFSAAAEKNITKSLAGIGMLAAGLKVVSEAETAREIARGIEGVDIAKQISKLSDIPKPTDLADQYRWLKQSFLFADTPEAVVKSKLADDALQVLRKTSDPEQIKTLLNMKDDVIAHAIAGTKNPKDIAGLINIETKMEAVEGLSNIPRSYLPIERSWERWIGPKFDKFISWTTDELGKLSPRTKKGITLGGDKPKEYVAMLMDRNTRISFGLEQASAARIDLSKNLTHAEKIRLGQIAKGGIESTTNVRLRNLISPHTDALQRLADDSVNYGLMSQKQATKYYGKYMRRMYKNYLSGGDWRPDTKTYDKAVKFITQSAESAGKALDEKQAKQICEDIIAGKTRDIYVGGKTAAKIRIDFSTYISRKHIPEPIRKLMGEIKEPALPFVDALRRETQAVENARLFHFVSLCPEWAAKKIPEIGAENYSRLVGKQYGDLNNTWVLNEVVDDIKDLESMQKHIPTMWEGAIRFFKKSKTIRQPSTATRNLRTNFVLNDVIGGVPFFRGDKIIGALGNYLKQDDIYLEARKTGLFRSTFFKAELSSLQKDILAEGNKGASKRLILEMMDKKAGDLYGGTEEVFKLAAYKYWRGKGLSPVEAKEIAARAIFEYDLVPPVVDTLRRKYIPFITFPYKALPAYAEAIAKRPVSAIKWMVMPTMVEEYGRQRAGLSKEALAEIRENMPEYMKNGLYSFIGFDKNEEPMFYDFTYDLPFGDLFETGVSIIGMPRALTPGNPLMTIPYVFYSGKDLYTGQEIKHPTTNKTMDRCTLLERFQTISDYCYKTMMPNLAPEIPGVTEGGYAYQQLKAAFLKKPDYRGQVNSLHRSALHSIGGFKTKSVNVEGQKVKSQMELRSTIEKIEVDEKYWRKHKGISEIERQKKLVELSAEKASLRYGETNNTEIEWKQELIDNYVEAINSGKKSAINDAINQIKKNDVYIELGDISGYETQLEEQLATAQMSNEERQDYFLGKEQKGYYGAMAKEQQAFYERKAASTFLSTLPAGKKMIENQKNYDNTMLALRAKFEGKTSTDQYKAIRQTLRLVYRKQTDIYLDEITESSKGKAKKGWTEFAKQYQMRNDAFEQLNVSPASDTGQMLMDTFNSQILDLQLENRKFAIEFGRYPGLMWRE